MMLRAARALATGATGVYARVNPQVPAAWYGPAAVVADVVYAPSQKPVSVFGVAQQARVVLDDMRATKAYLVSEFSQRVQLPAVEYDVYWYPPGTSPLPLS